MEHCKALLFINGQAPKILPAAEDFQLVGCTDGAFTYLLEKNFPLEQIDFVSGDFDSHSPAEALSKAHSFEIIHTPDQEKTDFDKALEIMLERGFAEVAVYGASGGEMDHFLGNLTVAYRYRNKLKITFFDDFSTYFFAENEEILQNVSGKMISLYPFPKAENIKTNGLNWEYDGGSLSQTENLGTRNFAVQDQVSVTFDCGDLILFIGEQYR